MSNMPHILVIDDEVQILRALRTILTARQFRISTARTGEEGLAIAAAHSPDVIILDLSLPDSDAIQVCSRLREWSQTPVIIISVHDSEQDKVAALDSGADDYLTKPFGIEELLARIRVALRHSTQSMGSKSPIIKTADLEIDLIQRTVTRNGEEVKLTTTEFKLLVYLAANAGRILTHQAILSHVWKPQDAEHVEYLRVYIRQLRRKLEADPDHPTIILNEPGIGYRFILVSE